MSIKYTARHTNITPEIKKYCERRLKSLEKLLGYPIDADLILGVEKYRHRVEINVKAKGTTLNTEEETPDMFNSVVAAFDNIEKRVKKELGKLRKQKRRKSRGRGVFPSLPLEEEEGQRRLIRSQDYSLKPMSIEEAIIQLETSKRQVFVFRKFDSEKWAVLYRRKDGNYGLVEPE
ncbi:MAG: ribosome-associated translation inhibitor RaiA [Candidatus Aminicenantes bacterium]|nr:MAG: ribosome-associated translation inhibitor RaiA [Candidatus Aminicenantes bacterium]